MKASFAHTLERGGNGDSKKEDADESSKFHVQCDDILVLSRMLGMGSLTCEKRLRSNATRARALEARSYNKVISVS